MEKIWNKTKPVTKKLLSLSSDINVVHSCMMYKIIIINDLMYVKNKLTNICKPDTEFKIYKPEQINA